MARLNSLEGIGDEVTLTGGSGGNTGGASGNYFDTVNVGASAVLVGDSASPIIGTRSLRTSTGATNTTAYAAYTLANVTSDFHRSYHRMGPSPSAVRVLIRYLLAGVQSLRVVVLSTGQIRVYDAAGVQAGTTAATTTNGVPFRIEMHPTFSATVGACELRLYTSMHSTTPAEVLNLTGLALTAAADTLRIGVGASAANASEAWHDGIAVEGATWFGPAVSAGTVTHSWVGAPAAAGFQVKAKVASMTSVTLAVSTDADMDDLVGTFGPTTADGDGYVVLSATGLDPGGAYFWQLRDVGQAAGPVGKARTLPSAGSPASFAFAFGGCQTNNNPQSAALDDIRAWDPAFFVHMGDLHYRDPNSSTLSVHRGHVETQILGAGGLAQLLREVPTVYVRSDHDAGPGDNLDSNTASNQASINAYKQLVPHLPLADVRNPTVGLYTSWVVGRCRFIMVDIRNMDRSPGLTAHGPTKTMLGATQLSWLLTELSQPELVKFLITDVAWMGDNPDPITEAQDKWPSYANERATIISHVQANNINVVVLHSDTHSMGRATAAKNTWGSFPVFAAAPLANIGGGRYLDTFSELYNTAAAQGSQYGRISVNDTGGLLTVQFDARDALNAVTRMTQTEVFGTAGGGSGITYVDSASVANTSSSTDITVPKPPLAADGDHLLAIIAHLKSGTPETTVTAVPAGFTLVGERLDGTGLRLAVYAGIRAAGAGAYTWTISDPYKNWGVILAHRGVHPDTPIRAATFGDYNPGTSFGAPAPAAEAGDWLITAIASRHAVTGVASTWSTSGGDDVERFEIGTAGVSGNDISGAVYDSNAQVPDGPVARTLTATQTESLIAAVSVLLQSATETVPPSEQSAIGWGVHL